MSLRRLTVAAAAFAPVVALSGACSFDPSLENLPCPCVEGWHCDPFAETCVENRCEPKIVVSDLEATWATPHSIRWTWKVDGVPSEFVKYELVLAENEEDLRTRSGTARVYDGTTNPELGLLEIPYSHAIVTSTVTRELEPLTSYLALLYVSGGNPRCESSTLIVEKKTPPPTLSEIVVIGEGPQPDGSRPRPVPGATVETVGTTFRVHYDGEVDTNCLEPPKGQTAQGTCGQPVGLDGLRLDVTRTNPAIDAASFHDAYLEVEVEVVDSPTPLWFGWIRLLTSSCGEQERYSFVSHDMVVPNINGKRTLLEAPFNQLHNYRNVGEETVVTPFEFATIDPTSGGTPICGINVGGQKHKHGDLIIHRARIVF